MNANRLTYYSSILLAMCGAVFALLTAVIVIQDQGLELRPLPGFILLDCMLLGILGFLGVFFSNKPNGSTWLKVTWFVVGALLPLVILGAFSIGLFVLFSMLFFLAAATILTIQSKGDRLQNIGVIILGVIGNLAIALLIILSDRLVG